MPDKVITFASFFDLLRIRQWFKNSFLIFPLVFSGRYLELGLWFKVLGAILGFSLLSSALYIVNDILDRKTDLIHPIKSQRPIASGVWKIKQASYIALGCFILAAIIFFYINPNLIYLSVIYISLHILYNFLTKKIIVIDVLTIALGFPLRVWAGGLAIAIEPSLWLQSSVFVLALFLSFSKRRLELENLGDKADLHRRNLGRYGIKLLDSCIAFTALIAILCYGAYTLSSEISNRYQQPFLFLTILFVIFGIFRYLHLIYHDHRGEDASQVLTSDTPLIINIVLWLISLLILIFK